MATNIVTPFAANEVYSSSARAKCISVADFWLGAGSTASVSTWGDYHTLINGVATALGLTNIADGDTGQQWLDRMNVVNNVESNTDTAALLARFTTPADATRTKVISKLVYDLKKAAVWSKLDALYLMAAADSQAARRNWIADVYNLTPVSAPTFTADRGYTGDGSSSYLETSFNPTTAIAPKFVQNSGNIGLWSRTSAQSTFPDAGNTNSLLHARNASDNFTGRINCDAATIQTANASGLGLFATNRVGSTSTKILKNGVSALATSDASAASTNATFRMLGRGGSGTSSSRQGAAGFFGQSLTDAEHLAFYNALNTYLTSIGAA